MKNVSVDSEDRCGGQARKEKQGGRGAGLCIQTLKKVGPANDT